MLLKKNTAVQFVFLLLLFSVIGGEPDYYKNVKFTKPNNVYITGIPLVRQKRMYCVPASVSMVLQYFDSNFSQKKLARLFGTSKKSGTFISSISEAFSSGEIPDFDLKEIYALTEKEQSELVRIYNEHNKRKRRKKNHKESEALSVFDDMEKDKALKLFPKVRSELAVRMRHVVFEYIESGVPLLWTVTLNLDPSSNAKGNHMRVITGYSKVGKRMAYLYYRDPSFGNRNLRKVKFDDAVSMTLGIHAITPVKYKISMPDDVNFENITKMKRIEKERHLRKLNRAGGSGM